MHSGVYSIAPETETAYEFQERVVLGTTSKTASEVLDLIQRLKTEWPGNRYHLTNRWPFMLCAIVMA